MPCRPPDFPIGSTTTRSLAFLEHELSSLISYGLVGALRIKITLNSELIQRLQTAHAFPALSKRIKKRSHTLANASVASSTASGNGFSCSPATSALTYGSRAHELTLNWAGCQLGEPTTAATTYLAHAALDTLDKELVGQLVGAVQTDGNAAALERFPEVAQDLGLEVGRVDVRAVEVANRRSKDGGASAV